jgi:thiamine-monophosphate kinase
MLASSLGPGFEFDRIRAMAERWKSRAQGLGDDCAFLKVGRETLAVSIDASVEDVHFRRAWMSAEEIGYRAAAAALSDLAAVAAEPIGLLVSIGAPASEPEATHTGIADGIGEAVAAAGAMVVGGDLTRSEQLIVDCCVIGRVRTPMRRAGARPGDRIVVTGTLGGPLAAVTSWTVQNRPPAGARSRFVHPEPRFAAAKALAKLGATAMIDISDGLGGDLLHLLAASGVGARVEVLRIPVHTDARAAAARLGQEAWAFAARSGEEYELLATLPASVSDKALEGLGVEVTTIGRIEAEEGVRAYAESPVTLPGGWDHLRTP